jgi:hypothetical protein
LTVTTTTSPSRARFVPSKPRAVPEPFANPPPCSHTITGRFAVSFTEGVKTFSDRQSSLMGRSAAQYHL